MERLPRLVFRHSMTLEQLASAIRERDQRRAAVLVAIEGRNSSNEIRGTKSVEVAMPQVS